MESRNEKHVVKKEKIMTGWKIISPSFEDE